VFKGVNTYAYVGSVALISAAAAATIENLHVVWTAIFVSLLQRRVLAGSWFINVLIILLGTAMTVGVFDHTRWNIEMSGGVGLAVLAGIAFALFIISWNQRQSKGDYLPQRALDTGVFLGFSGVMILVVHIAVGLHMLRGSWIPFSSITLSDFAVQLANGIFNIGVTYFLMSEALRVLEGVGQLASLLLSLALSYTVLFTVLFQFVLLGDRINLIQWCGVALFSIGFASIRYSLDALRKGPSTVSLG
ncbi:MAG: hypothetical protein LC775_18180, partial [Acidobacteria bacterium]|nr:hypothetical protein [Acidobacteriota bacterium]